MSNNYWAFKLVLWLLFALAFLALIVFPLLTSLLYNYCPDSPIGSIEYFRTVETIQTWMMRILTSAWFWFLGSCFASFLNVVAWRVPRGRSILGSSHCPNCNTKLTFKDNIPILGWLKNGGKCRYCHTTISKRYFNVEVILGGVFFYIVMLTIYSGGVTLPLRTPEHSIGFERNLFSPSQDLIQITAHHLTLLSLLFTLALVRLDNLKIPISIFVFGCILSVIFPLVFPAVQILSWIPSNAFVGYTTFDVNQLITVIIGMVTGLIIGAGFKVACIQKDVANNATSYSASAIAMSLMLIGAFLGWQSVLGVMVCMMLLYIVEIATLSMTGYKCLNFPAKAFASTVCYLTVWGIMFALLGYRQSL